MRGAQTSHAPKLLCAPLGLCPTPRQLHSSHTGCCTLTPLQRRHSPVPGSRLGGTGGDVGGMLPSPITPAACPHAGQPLAGLQVMPRSEDSLWVHWEAPPTLATAYVVEWQQVPWEPSHSSACWQIERDGATTTALIKGKSGAARGPCPSGHCAGSIPGVWQPCPSTKPCPKPSPHPPWTHTQAGQARGNQTPNPHPCSALRCRQHRAFPAVQHLSVPTLQGRRRGARPHRGLLQAEGYVCCQQPPRGPRCPPHHPPRCRGCILAHP